MTGICVAALFAAAAVDAEPAPPGDRPRAQAGSDASAPGDIVVTAQRRQESLQSVPIAAVAVTGDTLTKRGARDLLDLVFVSPSLRIDTPYGNTAPKITLRGVGSGSFNFNTETTVALYLDEFVLNASSAKLGQLFDLDRVEVLRGPQGTLYGKNSTGGAINYVTRRPDGTTAGDVTATVASFGEYDVQADVQTALSDSLSARVSFNRRYRTGYQYNTFLGQHVNDRNDWGGRLGVRYQSGGVDAYLKVFADRSHTDGFFINTYGVNPDGTKTADGTNPLTGYAPSRRIDTVAFDHPGKSDVDNRGATLNVDIPVGRLTLTDVSGYLHSKAAYSGDQDGSPVDAAYTEFSADTDQFSQELRLSAPKEDRFSWITGVSAFYQEQKLGSNYVLHIFELPAIFLQSREKTTSFAGFFDATYHLTDRLSLVGGARLTTDKRTFHHRSDFSLIGPFDIRRAKRWTEPTYRAGVNFQVDPATLLYASFNRGYRAGDFDIGFPSTTDQFEPVNPEFVNSYEAGVKANAFGRRLRVAADVFYSIFKDQQLLIVRAAPGSICCSLTNAGKARIYGAEIDGTALLTPDFDVSFQGSVIRAKYLEFFTGGVNNSGAQLPNVPRFQVRFGSEYRIPAGAGAFFIAPEVQVTGRQLIYESERDVAGNDVQRTFALVNAQIGYRTDRYSIFAFVKNATDKRYGHDLSVFTDFGFNQLTYAEPRIGGVTVTGKF